MRHYTVLGMSTLMISHHQPLLPWAGTGTSTPGCQAAMQIPQHCVLHPPVRTAAHRHFRRAKSTASSWQRPLLLTMKTGKGERFPVTREAIAPPRGSLVLGTHLPWKKWDLRMASGRRPWVPRISRVWLLMMPSRKSEGLALKPSKKSRRLSRSLAASTRLFTCISSCTASRAIRPRDASAEEKARAQGAVVSQGETRLLYAILLLGVIPQFRQQAEAESSTVCLASAHNCWGRCKFRAVPLGEREINRAVFCSLGPPPECEVHTLSASASCGILSRAVDPCCFPATRSSKS